MTTSIYILKLKESKYYVGKTSNIEKRLAQHSRGSGSSWTRKYPMDRLLRLYHNCDSYDEDKYTLKLMAKHGIENVRGGTYVSVDLSKEEVDGITRRIRMATDKCIKCGSSKHFAYRCRVKTITEPQVTVPRKKSRIFRPIGCEICFVPDHSTDDCPHL